MGASVVVLFRNLFPGEYLRVMNDISFAVCVKSNNRMRGRSSSIWMWFSCADALVLTEEVIVVDFYEDLQLIC